MIKIYHILALLCALSSSVGNIYAKRSVKEGATSIQVALFSNMFTPILFIPALIITKATFNWGEIIYPVIMGVSLYLGMILSYLALRLGDVSIQTPILGSKIIFITLFTVLLGLDKLKLTTLIAAALTFIAILMIGYVKGEGRKGNAMLSVLVGLASVILFVVTDIIIQEKSYVFGKLSFVFVGTVITATLLLCTAYIQKSGFRAIKKKTVKWLSLTAFFNCTQSALIAYSLSFFGHAAEFNIIQATRGFWVVALVWLFGGFFGVNESNTGGFVMLRRMVGALIMLFSVLLIMLF